MNKFGIKLINISIVWHHLPILNDFVSKMYHLKKMWPDHVFSKIDNILASINVQIIYNSGRNEWEVLPNYGETEKIQ